MNITKFLNFFIENNKTETISYGMERSTFNSGIQFSKICEATLQYGKYDQFNLVQTGLPRKSKDDQKITYCKSFNQALDNLQCIFNYEIAKHILYRINSKHILTNIKNKIRKSDKFIVSDLKKWFNLWFRIYNCSHYSIDPEKADFFASEVMKLPFYIKHPTVHISGIISGITSDLKSLDNIKADSINVIMEIKEISITLLDLILDCSIITNKNIVIDSISDLIIDDMDLFDIGYRGSFLKISEEYYKLKPDHSELIDTYMLSSILSELTQKILNYHVQLLDDIKELHPDFNVQFTQKFQTDLINVLFDFYIYLGIEISKEHNLLKCFEQSTRIHFRTLYTSIISILPKGVTYSDSQITLIHYALLTSNEIAKGIMSIPDILNDNKTEDA